MKPKVLVIGAFAALTACRQANVPPPAPPPAAVAPNPAAQRPVYRNSVIPGGVESSSELATRLSTDPAATAHYRGIAVSKLRPVRLDKARQAYVSYRTSSGIYWTKHRVPLREGELVLTDGQSEVRGRCGNRISDTPEQPVAQNEPPAEVFEETTPTWPTWGTVATEASEHANQVLAEQGAAAPVTNLASQPSITSPVVGDPAAGGSGESEDGPGRSGLLAGPMGGGGGIPPSGAGRPGSDDPGGAGSGNPVGPGISDPSIYPPPPAGSGTILMPARTAPTASAPWTLPPSTDPDPGEENPPGPPNPPVTPEPPILPPGITPPPAGRPPVPPDPLLLTPEPGSRLIFLLGAAMLAVLGISRKKHQG